MADPQSSTPIREALARSTKRRSVSFGVPGHEAGQGTPRDIAQVTGAEAFASDATAQKGTDDRREAKRAIQRAGNRAAEAGGADAACLPANGTSLGNHPAHLSVAAPGDTVLVLRNGHKSVTAGLILAGLQGASIMLLKSELVSAERFALDETRITLDIAGLGVTGYAAKDWLAENGQVCMGLSHDIHLPACFTLGHVDAQADALGVVIA